MDESGIGVLVAGPVKSLEQTDIDAAIAREEEVYSASDRCWAESGGAAAVADLQEQAMKEAEPLIASSAEADR